MGHQGAMTPKPPMMRPLPSHLSQLGHFTAGTGGVRSSSCGCSGSADSNKRDGDDGDDIVILRGVDDLGTKVKPVVAVAATSTSTRNAQKRETGLVYLFVFSMVGWMDLYSLREEDRSGGVMVSLLIALLVT